jgi:hypothetical protein
MKRDGYHFWLPVIAFGFSLLAWSMVVSACPGCKDALIEIKDFARRQATSQGYNLSIGLLLLVPAALVGGMTALLVRSARRKKAGLH